MKNYISIIGLLIVCLCSINAQTYEGPIAKPTSGYGADGIETVSNISIANPVYAAENITLFYPTGTTTAVPTICFAHGFALSSPFNYYEGFINFLVSKGYAVVFVPYPIADVGVTRYQIMEQGFLAAASAHTNIIDTSRVGFIGHSFGGGAIFAIANNLYTNNNWGANGMFLTPIAQWYSFNISQSQLTSFNPNAKLLTVINEDDTVCDHRMAIDMFQNINIANNEKDIALLKSDMVNGYNYVSDHLMVTTETTNALDALDYYGLYRLVDALADYTFTGNSTAKDVALGNGSALQITMPIGMSNLVVDDAMIAQFPESNYDSPCSSPLNPRIASCVTLSASQQEDIAEVSLYPNPSYNSLTINVSSVLPEFNVEIYNVLGERVLTKNMKSSAQTTLNISALNSGIYILKAFTEEALITTQKFIKQ